MPTLGRWPLQEKIVEAIRKRKEIFGEKQMAILLQCLDKE